MMKKTFRINRKRLVSTFLEMIRINSPSFHEGPMGDYLEAQLSALGFKVMRQTYGASFNILALKKGKHADALPLILSGHMDTIEPTEGIRYSIKENVISSTGDTVLGADDKSAVAQILEAVTAAAENGIPHGDIEIIFTSAEEKGLHGAKNLDYRKIQGRHALVLDSGGRVGKIVIAAPSHITYEMHVLGKPAHAGIEPEKGISAIRVAAEIIGALPDGRIDAETTANIGMVSGGTATNVVPREVTIHGEVRSHNPAVLKGIKSNIFRQAKEIAHRRNSRIRIAERKEYQAFRIKQNDPFLGFMNNVFLKCGIRPEHAITGGGSDANIFNAKGIRSINISTGMQNVHSTNEYIEVEDLVKGCRVVLAAIEHFTEFSEKKGVRQEKKSDALCSFPYQQCLRSGSCGQSKGRVCWRS